MLRLTGVLVFFVGLICSGHAQIRAWSAEEETTEYWYGMGEKELTEALSLEKLNTNVARNVILFLGDGMGIPTITAGRIMKGQLQNQSGEETVLAMDQFQHAGLSKVHASTFCVPDNKTNKKPRGILLARLASKILLTYSVNKQTADSASTATAFLCGVKANHYTIGLSGKARLGECSTVAGNEVNSVLHDSYLAGKSTGIVTTTQLAHATPAGAYAHSVDRRFYSDRETPSGCTDIAKQMYEKSDEITVALGGGRKFFTPDTVTDPEYPRQTGSRRDGANLINQWQAKYTNVNAHYVRDQAGFDSVDPVTTDKLLGMFEPDHMQYEVDRTDEPSLAEMTDKAIRILRKNSDGFFLLVEGGRIDHAHHSSNAHRALHELVAFDEAIQKAVDLTTDSDTLIIVTADHSHTMNMGGYSERGNPILGLAPAQDDPDIALDLKPYTTILYGNGPGFQGPLTGVGNREHVREDLTGKDTEVKSYIQQSAVPLASETHGGEDVAILARGPMSHLIHGVHEQNYIAHVMRYASCVGDVPGHCGVANFAVEPVPSESTPVAADFLGLQLDPVQTEVALYVQFVLLLCMVVFTIFLGFIYKNKPKMVKPALHSSNNEAYSGEKL